MDTADTPLNHYPRLVTKVRAMSYVNRQKIGAGAFADVYRCEREGIGQVVAMKVLRDSNDGEAVERFRREVRILSGLDHPNIIKVVDANL